MTEEVAPEPSLADLGTAKKRGMTRVCSKMMSINVSLEIGVQTRVLK